MILYLGNKLAVHGYTPTSVETLGERLRLNGYEIVTKSSKKNHALRLIDMMLSIIKYHSKNPTVLIDTYSTSAFWYAYITSLICKFYHLNYIPILRGGNLPKRIYKSPFRSNLIFNNSKINIATSSYLQQAFVKQNYNVKIIHNYIDLELYPFKLRSNIQPRLLWVRSFHEIYNPQLALLVLQKLKTLYPNATLCMVGPEKDGSLSACQKLADKLQLNVEFCGKLSKIEWINLSANYDIFINTTNVDNTPISVMEAMALGMPVVTTNVGGIPFLFQDDIEGIMVNKNSVTEMTDVIISLINEPAKTEIISLAARKKAATWDWQLIKMEWIMLLNSVGENQNVTS
jgi:L-malate glycosyltransferase